MDKIIVVPWELSNYNSFISFTIFSLPLPLSPPPPVYDTSINSHKNLYFLHQFLIQSFLSFFLPCASFLQPYHLQRDSVPIFF